MQPANSQIAKPFRFSEIRNHTSDILFKNKGDQFRAGAQGN